MNSQTQRLLAIGILEYCPSVPPKAREAVCVSPEGALGYPLGPPGTLPGHFRDTSGTLPEHARDTPGTLPGRLFANTDKNQHVCGNLKMLVGELLVSCW